MKFIYFKSTILLAIMLAISFVNVAAAEDVELLLNDPEGSGPSTTTLNRNYVLFYTTLSSRQHMSTLSLIPQAEMEAAGGRSGSITSLALRLDQQTTNALNPAATIDIYLANVPWSKLNDMRGGASLVNFPVTDQFLADLGIEYTQVYSMDNFSFEKLHAEHFRENGTDGELRHYDTNLTTSSDEREAWPEFNFVKNDFQPFEYTGGAVLVKICWTNAYGSGSVQTNFRVINVGATFDNAYKATFTNTNAALACSAPSTNTSQWQRPWIKLGMSLPELPSNYLGSEVQQATVVSATRPGDSNIPVLKFAVRVKAGEPVVHLDNVVFDGKSSVGVITAAKLYYTEGGVQAANSFDINTAELIATLDFPNSWGNTNVFDFKLPAMALSEVGWHNFWLVYDIYKDSPVGDNIIDAKLTSMHIYNSDGDIDYSYAPTKTPDPDGSIAILSSGYRYAGAVDIATGFPITVQDVGVRVQDIQARNYPNQCAPPGFNHNMEYAIIQYPPEAFGGIAGYIKRLAFYVSFQANVISGNADLLDNVYIFLKNNNKTTAGLPDWPSNIASKLQGENLGDWNSVSMFSTEEFIELAEKDGFKLVKGPFNWDINNWPDAPMYQNINNTPVPTHNSSEQFWTEDLFFDEPFEYAGEGVDIIIFKANWHRAPGTDYSLSRRFQFGGYVGDHMRFGNANIEPKNANTPPSPLTSGIFTKYPYGTTGRFSYQDATANSEDLRAKNTPFLRSYVSYITGQYYNQPRSFHGAVGTAAGAQDANIRGICIEVTGENEAPFVYLKDLGFTGTNDFNLVRNAKLYYSGSDSAFSTLNKVARDFAIYSANDIANIKFDLSDMGTENGLKLGLGKHFFWLSFEVAANAPTGQALSAKVASGTIYKVPTTGANEVFDISALIVDNNPGSETIINNQMEGGNYTVGGATQTERNYPNLHDLARDVTERGVKGNMQITVINNLTASQPAVFGVSPSASHIEFTLQSVPGVKFNITYNDNIPENADKPVIWLAGAKNFTIKNLNITRQGFGAALKFSGVDNVTIDSTTLTGYNDVVNVLNSQNFSISNSTLLGSYNYGINVLSGSSNGNIYKNTFGSATAGLRNGIMIQDGSNNLNIYENYFHSLAGDNTKATLFNIVGQSDRQSLSINIMNNIINDVKATETASVFEIVNASDVRIYHNTILIQDAGSARNVQMFYLPTNTNSLIVRNNLFSNTASTSGNTMRHQFFWLADRAKVFANPEDGDYNLYNGNPQSYTFGRNINAASTIFSLSDWKVTSGYEMNSNTSVLSAKYTTDNHIDGAVVGENGMLCPMLTGWLNADVDMDGPRGLNDPDYAGYTTIGADEAKISIRGVKPTLVENYYSCASSSGGITYEIEKVFDKWLDGVSREYVPGYRNYWYNVLGQQLIEEDGWYANEDQQDPFLTVPSPKLENTCEFYCISQIGYFQSKSNNSQLAIIVPPYIPNLEDIYICAEDNTTLALDVAIEGMYKAWQWQRKTNAGWENTTHKGEGFYDVGFEENFVNPSTVEGTYRLSLQPYSECGDRTPAYLSNEFTVIVGNRLQNDPPLYLSNTQEEMLAGICANTQGLWFASGVPTGNADKDVIGYQWHKKVAGTDNDWLPISASVNPTAITDTLRLAYIHAEDAGIYRCQVIGVPACGNDNSKWSNEATLNVNLAAEITQPPVTAFVCVGDNLINGFSIELFEPEHLLNTSTFQWYKDGKPLTRLKDEFIVGGSRISLRTNEKTLSFESARLEDGGEYQVQITYINCDGDREILMTTPVYLNVKDETYIVSQSTKIYGVRGGYTSLEVVANTSGKPLLDASVTYQWYRKYSDSRGSVKLNDNSKLYGTNTSLLTIVNLTDDDMTLTNEDYYYCVIKDWCLGDSLVSEYVTLALAPDINIDTHPSAIQACEGDDVTLTIAATSTDPAYSMSYQWFKEGVLAEIQEGRNQTTLTLTNVSKTDAASYYCIVSFVDLSGTKKQTNKAEVTVEAKPIITQLIAPSNSSTLPLGDPLRLEIVTGDPNGIYNYEWYLNGFLLPNSNNAVYYVEITTTTDAGRYHCVVKSANGCGEATSDPVDVNVLGIIENDDPFFHIESVLPNPVTNEAIVKFMLPETSLATLTLLDFAGRELIVLHSGNFAGGTNQVQISNKLSAVANGTYFVVLESKGRKAAMKITISR